LWNVDVGLVGSNALWTLAGRYQRFGGTYCLIFRAEVLKMEALYYSETLVPTVHRLGVGETVVVGEQMALNILLWFLCNISFHLSCAPLTLVLSFQHLHTVVLARVVPGR
jgi:hypothetical protein